MCFLILVDPFLKKRRWKNIDFSRFWFFSRWSPRHALLENTHHAINSDLICSNLSKRPPTPLEWHHRGQLGLTSFLAPKMGPFEGPVGFWRCSLNFRPNLVNSFIFWRTRPSWIKFRAYEIHVFSLKSPILNIYFAHAHYHKPLQKHFHAYFRYQHTLLHLLSLWARNWNFFGPP